MQREGAPIRARFLSFLYGEGNHKGHKSAQGTQREKGARYRTQGQWNE